MRKTKEQKGITLIALIITIIVLLILAVVAIGAVQDDGIIDHAKNARDQYSTAQTNENSTIQAYLDKIKEHVGTGSGVASGTGGDSTVSKLLILGSESVEVDGTITLEARETLMKPKITEIEWSSSNPEVATVDENGVVTGVSASKGTTIITARSTKDNKVSATKEITVEPKLIQMCGNCNDGYATKYKCKKDGCGVVSAANEVKRLGEDEWLLEKCGHHVDSQIQFWEFTERCTECNYNYGEN